MSEKIMTGVGKHMLKIPDFLWRKQLASEKGKIASETRFVTPEIRRVHHFVVRELPGCGGPMSPEFVAEGVDLPLDRVTAILDELEAHMTFLFRNGDGAVVWAYPVTVEETPHRLTFSSGETLYAA